MFFLSGLCCEFSALKYNIACIFYIHFTSLSHRRKVCQNPLQQTYFCICLCCAHMMHTPNAVIFNSVLLK
uniref:Uncharacterized protein n=1 Tax=Amphiprion ocellaris TaxID=80972 RepID=A0A3Q1BB92_AMPOC